MVDPRRLTERDLDFIVQTTATSRQDHDHIKSIVRDKPDLLDIMLNDERLYLRLTQEEAWVQVSPYLFFSVLLRRTRRDLDREPYTMEWLGRGQRVPVFDSHEATALLADGSVLDYLAQMLASFTRVETSVVYYRWRGRLRRRRFSDMDVDDVLALSQNVDPESRFAFYKRAADIALFMVGVFPDYVARSAPLSPVRVQLWGRRVRTLEEYEDEGRRFYRMAAEQAEKEPSMRGVLARLGEQFDVARKPLNFMSERYIFQMRHQWFGQPSA